MAETAGLKGLTRRLQTHSTFLYPFGHLGLVLDTFLVFLPFMQVIEISFLESAISFVVDSDS